MVDRIKGDEFEADPSAEGEFIYLALGSGRVTITDETFVPKSWRYTALHNFSYRSEEDQPRMATPAKEITLGQEEACRLMSAGFIKPVDKDGWIPKRLLFPNEKDGEMKEVKQMFDDVPTKETPWLRRKEDSTWKL